MGDPPGPGAHDRTRRGAPGAQSRAVRGTPSTLLTRWGPLVAWVAVVWALGGAGYSQDDTSSFLLPLLRSLLPALDADSIAFAHFAIRKSAHVFEYGVTCLLALRALASLPWLAPRAWVPTAIALCALLAGADELRQRGTAGREGALGDVMIDLGGAAGAAAVLWLLPRAWRERWLGDRTPRA